MTDLDQLGTGGRTQKVKACSKKDYEDDYLKFPRNEVTP